jgi:hypothetical protein
MDLYEARSAMRAALSRKVPDPRAAVDAFWSLEPEARQLGALRVFYGPLFEFMLPDPADVGALVLDADERLREDVLDGLALTWVKAPGSPAAANRVRLGSRFSGRCKQGQAHRCRRVARGAGHRDAGDSGEFE